MSHRSLFEPVTATLLALQYAYDALGLVESVEDGDALVAEYQSGAITARYVHGPATDNPVIAFAGAAMTSANAAYLIADRQGSIVATANTSGAVTANQTYDAYGVPASWTGTRFRYTGQIAIPQAELYYYKARIYDPVQGRFLQTDPVGYGPDVNWYAYVGNDPVNGADPSGNSAICGRDCDETYGSFGDTEASDATLGDQSQTGSVGAEGGSAGPGRSAPDVGHNTQLASNEPPGIGHNGGPPLGEGIVEGATAVEKGIVEKSVEVLGRVGGPIVDILTPTPAGTAEKNFFSQQSQMLSDAASGNLTGDHTLPGNPISRTEMDARGRVWVGPDAKPLPERQSGAIVGLRSASTGRIYRFPTDKGGGVYQRNLQKFSAKVPGYINIHVNVEP